MPVTLYDATVARFLQSLGAVSGYLEKGLAHCEDNNIDLNEIVETRLYPDMLPFRFQLIQVASHSIGAVSGALAGEYKPGPAAEDLDYRALQDLINDAQTGLQQVSAYEVSALEGKFGARSCGNTAIDNGTRAIASCSRLPSSRSLTKRRIQIIKLESKATTHSIPGARIESCSGSGPKPRGNKTITSKKNSNGLITSLGDRTISIRCRSV